MSRGTARTGRARSRSARTPDGRASNRAGANDPVDPEAKARQICLDQLATKARTRAELAATLARRGIDEDVAQRVLDRFTEVGLIDDAAFAEGYVHAGHAYRGLGRRALSAQLRRRGVDEETAGEAVAAVEPAAEEEMARTLVRRRLTNAEHRANVEHRVDDVNTIRKLVGMLARRGYPEGLSYRVVRDELRVAGRDVELLDGIDLDEPTS